MTLDVIIHKDGTATVTKIVRGLDPELDPNAKAMVEKKWRFEPATKNGQPVDVQLQVTINYHLY